MRKLLSLLFLLCAPSLASAADNIVINQANGAFAIMATSEASNIHTLKVSCSNCATSSTITIGTTTITSGTNTRVFFDDNGVVGEDAGLTYNKTAKALAVGLTGAPSSTNFSILGDATNTFISGVSAAGAIHFAYTNNWGTLAVYPNAASLGQVRMASDTKFGWSINNTSSALNVILQADAANTLALRNGTAAQKFSLYGTFTDASNYERLGTSFNGSTYLILAENAGTGSANRNIALGSGTGGSVFFGDNLTNFWRVPGTTGHFLAVTDNTYDIGASLATRPRTGYFGTGLAVGGGITVQTGFGVGVAAGDLYYWAGRSIISSPANGVVQLTDSAQTSFSRLQFGGVTSSFPALKRSTTVLQFRLADDSAFTSFTATTGILNALTSDAGVTDATVCVDSSTGQLLKGSGTLGICLGTSSARYKQDIIPLDTGLPDILALSPVNFRYIKGYGDDGAREQFGLIAEDVVKVLPKLVSLDNEGRPNSVDLVGMIPIIIRAIQELKADNDNLRISLKRASR